MHLDHAPCGFLTFTPDGTIVQINKTLLKWVGSSADEIVLKKKFVDLISRGGRLYYQMYVFPLLSMQDAVNEISVDLVSAAQANISCLLNAVVERDSNGAIGFIHASLFNITDRKKYEVELFKAKSRAEEEQKRFAFLANTLPNMIWTVLPSGTANFYNARFVDYFQFGEPRSTLQLLRKALFAEDFRNVIHAWITASKAQQEVQWELCLRGKNGLSRWFFVRIIPCTNNKGELLMWLGSCTDINTQKVEQLQIMDYLQSELSSAFFTAAHKTQVLKELAFEQSHLVRSPVAKILALLTLMQDKQLDEETTMIVSLLKQSAAQLDEVISSIVRKSHATPTG